MDNYAFIKLTIVREAERERGGGCIIGVLENEIDSHLQILKKARQNT